MLFLYDRKGKGRRGVGGGGGGQERGGKEERRYLTIGYLGELTRDQEETLTRSPLRECQNIHANVKRYRILLVLPPCSRGFKKIFSSSSSYGRKFKNLSHW
jgi:hypothetical protein